MGHCGLKCQTSEGLAVSIGTKAWRALLEEVYTTPKPGLVDLYSNGAHTDMDVSTFENSAHALKPYFIGMARQGQTLFCSDENLFTWIRQTGKAAEAAMYQATCGVNTHKGLIFTLGIYCAAAGRCIQRYGYIFESGIREIQQSMTASVLTRELEEMRTGSFPHGKTPVTNGQKNLNRYGTSGIRGEAIRGYPALWNCALPEFRKGMKENRDFNLIKLQTLFKLMSCVEDSNVLSRHDPQTLSWVQNRARRFLKHGGAYAADAYAKLVLMDQEFIQENISSGGCADLLAAAIFMNMLLEGS